MKLASRGLMMAAVLALFLLSGCPRPAPTPAPTQAPPTPTPDGWAAHTSGDVTILLPADWEVLELSQGDLQSLFADFQKSNPEIAKMIGSADALQGVALWAFRTAEPNATFIDNLNIRRSPLGTQKVDRMQDVVTAVLDQYRQLGWTVTASQADLDIGGRAAAHIAYSLPITGSDGQPTTLSGHQYLVLTPTDLWILSYSAGPGSQAALAPVFERSARSFQAK